MANAQPASSALVQSSTQGKQLSCRVTDDHDLALGLPASYQPQQDCGVLRCRAVAPSQLGAGGWRERRDAQERERPRPTTPRDRHQDGETQPVDALRGDDRSEEHTSELQSRQYLVCRLLLEKKKT